MFTTLDVYLTGFSSSLTATADFISLRRGLGGVATTGETAGAGAGVRVEEGVDCGVGGGGGVDSTVFAVEADAGGEEGGATAAPLSRWRALP